MNNIVDISQLRKDFELKVKNKELKEFAEVQHTIIEKLLQENKNLIEKVTHLEQLLTDISKNNMVSHISPEEMICLEQISLLKQKSNARDLTLEETKKLDILVRNLKLIREESTIIVNQVDPSGIKEAELVAIATGKPVE